MQRGIMTNAQFICDHWQRTLLSTLCLAHTIFFVGLLLSDNLNFSCSLWRSTVVVEQQTELFLFCARSNCCGQQANLILCALQLKNWPKLLFVRLFIAQQPQCLLAYVYSSQIGRFFPNNEIVNFSHFIPKIKKKNLP